MKSLAERWGTDGRSGAEAQLTLDCAKTAGRGGRRANAGRPPKGKKGERATVAHEARATHRAWMPVHVTLRRVEGLPNLRLSLLHDEIVDCIRDTQSDAFRVVHYSIQSNHIHFLLEANDGVLATGIRSLAVRIAKRMNGRVLKRHGAFFESRYHRHDLRTPREVRHALIYVLANGHKHGEVARGELDPCSSAAWFDGWTTPPSTTPAAPCPVRAAETWLLRVGWTKVFPGHLFASEVPCSPRPIRAARVKGSPPESKVAAAG